MKTISGTIGCKIHNFESIDSTNDEADRLASKGAAEGEVVIADCQTSGRGRLDRHWESPAGKNIYLSLILRPPTEPQSTSQLTLVAAVVVAETLAKFSKEKPFVKWPNDVLIDGKKVCGILTEASASKDKVEHVIIGIGINVNTELEDFSDEIKETATSLLLVNRSESERDEIVSSLFQEFEKWYRLYLDEGFSSIRKKYISLSCLEGQKVEVVFGDEHKNGVAHGIDESGALLLKRDNGQVEQIIAGDVNIASLSPLGRGSG